MRNALVGALSELTSTFLLSRGMDIEADMNSYIDWLHRYNELKDAGQMLLGKLAELQGLTTKEMYGRFSLDLED